VKILQITPFFYPSVAGIETYVLNLSQSLSQREHQVDVLTVNTQNAPKEDMIADRIKVYRCSPTFRYRKLFVSLELARKLLKAKDYDLYHIQTPCPFTLEVAIAASRINHIPLVATYHCEGTTSTPGIVYSIMAKLYDLYTGFSRRVSLRYVGRLVCSTLSYPESLRFAPKIRERIRIVTSGVDIERFSPLKEGSKLRAKYGFDSNDRVVLFVGSLDRSHRYKGVDYLIKAVHLARKESSDVKLVIVGGGDLAPKLKKLVQELHLGQNVVFTGSIPDEELPLHYAMCDIFVLPSFSKVEAFGLVLFEAMASGKPCIASDIPGVRDVLKNGKTGLLVPPRDPEALAQAILRLAEDNKLKSEMAQNARRDVESCTWQNCAERIEAVYKEIATSGDSIPTS